MHPARPVVSVQRLDRGNAVDRHLTWGAHVAPDLVVAPESADGLLGRDDRPEVLLASFPVRGPVVVERIAVAHVHVIRLAGRGPGLAALTLRSPSRHFPVPGVFDLRKVAASIEEAGSVYAGLVAAGFVDQGIDDQPLELLRRVVEHERREHEERVEVEELATALEVSTRFCCWVPWSKCCWARGERPPGGPGDGRADVPGDGEAAGPVDQP